MPEQPSSHNALSTYPLEHSDTPLPELSGTPDRWLRRLHIGYPDGTGVEVVDTEDEVACVLTLSDGGIVLPHRLSPALSYIHETPAHIPTILSKAHFQGGSAQNAAIEALNKLQLGDIPLGDTHPAITEVGTVTAWKYLTSKTRCFRIHILIPTDEFVAQIRSRDPSINGFSIYTEQALLEKTRNGTITDLRAVTAVQFALLEKDALSRTPAGFAGDPQVLNLLGKIAGLTYEPLHEEPPADQDWFPRVYSHGDEIIYAPSNQVQILGIKEDPQKGPVAVFLAEPVAAHGRWELMLPGGSIRQGESHVQTAIQEMREEAGYTIHSVRQLTPDSYLMPLYLTHQSSVCVATVADRGEPRGGDELPYEQGIPVEIPLSHIPWYIANGYITDASVLAGLFTLLREDYL